MGLRRKVEKQWKTVKIVCVDQRRVCTKKGNYGRAHGLLSNRITVCYKNHKKKGNKAFCELADTLLHEAGHAFQIPKGQIKHEQGDRIWNMGRIVRTLCREMGLDRAVR